MKKPKCKKCGKTMIISMKDQSESLAYAECPAHAVNDGHTVYLIDLARELERALYERITNNR